MNAKNAAIFSGLVVLALFIAGVWTYAVGAEVVPAVADNPAPAALAAFLSGTVFPVVGSLLMGVVSMLLVKLGNKFHIDALTQKNNILERLAFQGITLAEEKAAQLAGSRSALTGDQKIDLAISHILHFMPKISAGQAESLVESMLAQISGVGSTGATAYSQGASLSLASTVIPEPAVSPLAS
jgi:hypothetical protein